MQYLKMTALAKIGVCIKFYWPSYLEPTLTIFVIPKVCIQRDLLLKIGIIFSVKGIRTKVFLQEVVGPTPALPLEGSL